MDFAGTGAVETGGVVKVEVEVDVKLLNDLGML